MTTIDIIKRSIDGTEQEFDMALSPISGEIAAEFSGIWSSNQAATIKWTAIGNMVGVTIETIQSISNTAATINLVGLLPVELRPEWDISSNIRIMDNTTGKTGSMTIKNGGSIEIFSGQDGENFSGTGNSGYYTASVFYLK